MKNVRIVVTENNTIVVKADTKRYGRDAIMFEERTFMRCCDYIRRVTRSDHFRLKGHSCAKPFTDAEGRTMPWIMSVEFDEEEEKI